MTIRVFIYENRPREERCDACQFLDNGPCCGPLCRNCGCCE
jgi:hypothetical protein